MEIELNFEGPYCFGSGGEEKIPSGSGVYLRTVETPNGRFAFYVGESKNILWRIEKHCSRLLAGSYQIFDYDLLKAGKELKRIYAQGNNTGYLLKYFTKEISEVAWKNLACSEWYWAQCEDDKILRQSIESAIIRQLRDNSASLDLLENDRVSRGPELAKQVALKIKFSSPVNIVGLPNSISYGKL